MEALKLYTEAKNTRDIIKLLDQSFGAYSISYGRGQWQGKAEQSFIAEVISDSPAADLLKLEAIAEAIKRENKQDAVLITSTPINAKLV